MLAEFPGALVFISHDRAFLDDLATRIVAVEDGSVRSFAGNYSAYKRAREAEAAEALARAERAREEARKRAQPRADGGAGQVARKPAKNPWAFRKLEEAIIALEEERSSLLAALGEERVYRDPTAMRETQTRLAEIERDLQEKNLEWERWVG
jgi:ATP-binding cassette subfamily F protein uup